MLKRSEINKSINEAIGFLNTKGYFLPPFAYFTIDDWKNNKLKIEEIIKAKLGWDVTDFGSGNFLKTGRTIFTLRNGYKTIKGFSKTYAQKVMYLIENQRSPIHFHQTKTEDIINQGNGRITIKLWNKTKDNFLSKKPLLVSMDGMSKFAKAGEKITLKPGESICVKPKTFHQFWAQKNYGETLSIEISNINNDLTDNYWLKKINRFPEIIEDEKAKYCLCFEYKKFLK